MFNLPELFVALEMTLITVIGKLVSGLGAGKANKLLIGTGMIPKGEVGLIFVVPLLAPMVKKYCRSTWQCVNNVNLIKRFVTSFFVNIRSLQINIQTVKI